MSQQDNTQEIMQPVQPVPQSTALTVPNGEPGPSKTKGKLARRALLAAAGVGVCAAGVELAPIAVKRAGDFTQAQVSDAFQAGVNQGRQALLDELAQLEGITLDGAISIAELTRLAVKVIVLPLAQLNATITGDMLAVLDSALTTARDNLGKINVHIDALNNLQRLVETWRANVTQLPMRLEAYVTADINGAENYLKALKQKIADERAADHAANK
ncbi:MAG TPA: hypothetical protein VGP82_04000 [Ktedonobacterales bacterium]|nr:hypothetical protein [Ktedonobacterales bacterium]